MLAVNVKGVSTTVMLSQVETKDLNNPYVANACN